jgi:phosphomevalonate kinase
MTLHYSAPGKLFISGEWAILEVGNFGLVAAVDNRVHVTIEPAAFISINAEEFGISAMKAEYLEGKLLLVDADDNQKKTLGLLAGAMTTSLNFLTEHGFNVKPFSISTSSKDTQFMVDGVLKKVGFGSSAAVVVATIAALLDFHGYRATKEEIYKLSTIAHFYAQGKVGSAFDVAASAFGGLFVYSRFDPDWLVKKVESGESLASIVREKWPSLVIEELPVPEDFRLLVGWTGDSASTTAMIKQMNEFKAAKREEYDQLISSIAHTAQEAVHAFKKDHRTSFLYMLNKNEELLRNLTSVTGVPIETPELRILANIAENFNAAGKLSGAGGGDCGIAVCFDEATEGNILQEWETKGLYPLGVTIDRQGVKRDN